MTFGYMQFQSKHGMTLLHLSEVYRYNIFTDTSASGRFQA